MTTAITIKESVNKVEQAIKLVASDTPEAAKFKKEFARSFRKHAYTTTRGIAKHNWNSKVYPIDVVEVTFNRKDDGEFEPVIFDIFVKINAPIEGEGYTYYEDYYNDMAVAVYDSESISAIVRNCLLLATGVGFSAGVLEISGTVVCRCPLE
jgi:hypothetical protein